MIRPIKEARIMFIKRTFLLCLFFTSLVCSESQSLSLDKDTDGPAYIRRDDFRWVLGNASLERIIETRSYVHTITIVNKLSGSGRRYAVESHGFILSLDNDKLRLTAADFRCGEPRGRVHNGNAELVLPLTCDEHGICVTVVYSLGKRAFYTRKRLEIDPGEHLLNWVDVDSFRLDDGKLQRFDQKPMPFPIAPWDICVGRPLFAGRELFFGVEHPASINSFDEQGWVSLRQHPGRKDRVVTSPAVIGVCPDKPRQRLLDYFKRYIDQNRARPVKRSIQWVAYFDASMEDDFCREKIAVAEKIFRKRDVPLDLVLMDSGWTEPQSIMRISRKRPDRLALMNKLVSQRLGTKLGLHVITSGVKPMVDKDWLAEQGYDLIYHKNKRRGAYCFADPRIFTEFRDNLVSYVRQYDIAAYKFDWGHFKCGQAGHRGHLAGAEYAFEACANNFIRVHDALRQINPDIFLFNTGWYSPWWLWSYDAIFCAGADYNFGLGGPPSFSTASLLCTWRDATIRGNLVRWSPYFPLDSLMTVDPVSHWWHIWDVRSESPLRPFTDYFVMACLRGTQMTEIYNNISAWSDVHADAAAAVLKWIKAYDDIILASTRYIGGDPLEGEPYGYAHFTKDNRAIIVVRNPTIEQRTITIGLDERAGMWPSDKQYVVRTIYPYMETEPEAVRYGSICRQNLYGDEVRVLEILPLDNLPEPIPLGCRYQVVSRNANKTVFRIANPSKTVRLFSPAAIRNGKPIAANPHLYVVSSSHRTSLNDSLAACKFTALQVDGDQFVLSVNVAKGAQARAALLMDLPGQKCEVMLDGKTVSADAPHIQLADAKNRNQGPRAKASAWSLFGIDVGPGEREIRFHPQNTAKTSQPKGRVIVDFYAEIITPIELELCHDTIEHQNKPLLPQTWIWQSRSAKTMSWSICEDDL